MFIIKWNGFLFPLFFLVLFTNSGYILTSFTIIKCLYEKISSRDDFFEDFLIFFFYFFINIFSYNVYNICKKENRLSLSFKFKYLRNLFLNMFCCCSCCFNFFIFYTDLKNIFFKFFSLYFILTSKYFICNFCFSLKRTHELFSLTIFFPTIYNRDDIIISFLYNCFPNKRKFRHDRLHLNRKIIMIKTITIFSYISFELNLAKNC